MKDRWCPKAQLHTHQPTGYVQWHEWAEQKSRRHYQVRCPGCGLFSIWKRKRKSGQTEQETEQ